MIRVVAIGAALVTACAGAFSPAHAAPSSFAVSGTIASKCQIGSNSYSVSVAWVKNASAQITLDGTTGNLAATGTTTAVHSYTTLCNSGGTLTMTLPATSSSAVPYTITVKNDIGTTIATATSPASVPVVIPVTSSTWTITAQATQVNGNPVSGTYTAMVTIQ